MKSLTKNNRAASMLLLGLLIFWLPGRTSAQQIVFSPDTLYMGKIPTSSQAVRGEAAFNISSTTLEITSIAIQNDASGSFSILNNPGTASLGIAKKVIIEIEFKPTTAGLLEAELVFTSNTIDDATTVQLYGKGTAGGVLHFERIFGPEDGGGLSAIVQTADGGYFLSGSTPNLDEDVADIYLAKTDQHGDLTWSGRIVDDEYSEGAGEIVPLSDGNYLLFGNRTRQSAVPRPNMQLMKIDGTGNTIWAQTYGDDGSDEGADIVATSDGSYLLCGSSDSFPRNGVPGKDVYLVKVNDVGVEQWSKTYGGEGGDTGSKIIATDGGYLILASSTSWAVDSQDQDFYLVKIDSDGELLWETHFGGILREGAADVAELPGGGYAVAGYSQLIGKGREMYLATVDAAGELVWERRYGEEYQDGASNVLVADDGIIISGSIQVLILQSQSGSEQYEYSDIFVIKTDFDGNELWRYQFGGYRSEGASEMVFNAAGNIVITGSTSSYATNGSVFFLSFTPSGVPLSIIGGHELTLPSVFHLKPNYPNPFNASTVIPYDLDMDSRVRINIYNLRGQKIRTLLDVDQRIGRHTVGFDASDLSSGVYFYELQTGRGAEVKKMLLLK
jgi:hypothetical protein